MVYSIEMGMRTAKKNTPCLASLPKGVRVFEWSDLRPFQGNNHPINETKSRGLMSRRVEESGSRRKIPGSPIHRLSDSRPSIVIFSQARHVALPRDAETDGSAASWVRQSRRAVRCAAEPRNEFLGRKYGFLLNNSHQAYARQGALRPNFAVLERRAFRVWVPTQSMGTSI